MALRLTARAQPARAPLPADVIRRNRWCILSSTCPNASRMRHCHQPLNSSYQAPSIRPCPRCGSSARRVQVGEALAIPKVEIFGKLNWRSGEKRNRKPLRSGVTGDDFYKASGRWSSVTRVIDRLKDWYYEHIIDRETGQVLRHCDEKLSDHKGRGSARRSKRKKDT
jgi:hypothetical protein